MAIGNHDGNDHVQQQELIHNEDLHAVLEGQAAALAGEGGRHIGAVGRGAAARLSEVQDHQRQDGEDQRQKHHREGHDPILEDLDPFFIDDRTDAVHVHDALPLWIICR